MDSLPPLSPADADRQLTAVSVSALSFLCWESCITFEDEVKFIWSKSNKSHIKWLYLLTRYVGLAAFAGNRFIGVGGSHPALSCKSFLSYQVTMTQVLVTLVQTILMLRVYALYNRDYRMGSFLVLLTIAGTIIAVAGATSTIPNAQFNAVCGIVHIGSVMTSFRFAFVAIESILLLLTVIKCIYTFRVTRQPVPLITLLLRDGMLAFIAIVSILIPTSVTLVVDHGKFVSMVAPWFTAILSCAGCRLIINMQELTLTDDQTQDAKTPSLITSRIEIGPTWHTDACTEQRDT